MQYFSSRDCRPIVMQLARERTLCAFDFDGTLAPIVPHPDEARMRDRTRQLLDRLTTLYPCVVISGRARADLVERLSGLNLARVLGNHGAETEQTTRQPHAQLGRWKAAIELVTLPGVWVEDKGLSLAVHYRQAAQKGEALRRILAAARNLEKVRVLGGKQVVNLIPEQLPHKGEALATERDRLGCDWVLYVGDDENDEDAFGLKGNIVAVRIGWERQSHARYYLHTQAEIDQLLERLFDARERGDSI